MHSTHGHAWRPLSALTFVDGVVSAGLSPASVFVCSPVMNDAVAWVVDEGGAA